MAGSKVVSFDSSKQKGLEIVRIEPIYLKERVFPKRKKCELR